MYCKHLDVSSTCRNCDSITYPYWVTECANCGEPHWDQVEYDTAQNQFDAARDQEREVIE